MWWEQQVWEVAGEAAVVGAAAMGTAVYAAIRSQRGGNERTADEVQAEEARAAGEFDPKRTLDRLAAYRKRDPEYRLAIGSFVQAEVTQVDPVEGYAFEEDDGSEAELKRHVHEILGA